MYPSELVGPRELIETIPKWGRYRKSNIVIEREGERERERNKLLTGACYFSCWSISFICKLADVLVLYHYHKLDSPIQKKKKTQYGVV